MTHEDHPTRTQAPPGGLPRYRILTGVDDDAFCHRVSEALELGYVLHGSPALTTQGETVIAGQALIWRDVRSQAASCARTSGATSLP
jgi:hypothetical protein